jgi:putative Holliday junction resolvase
MKSKARVLAIDYGSKRIGLAMSDELRILARPIGVLEQSGRSLSDLVALVEKEGVGTVIVGLPRTMAGTESEMTVQEKLFAEKLFIMLDKIAVKHEFYDERFTSLIAAENIRQQNLKKSQRREKYRHDEEAARIILQEYLDLQK